MLACRCIPGSRLTGYTAAGLTRSPFGPFALAVTLSGLLWVALVLGAARGCGRGNDPRVVLLGLALGLLGLRWAFKGGRRVWRLRWASLGRWAHAEFWPGWLFYAPVAVHYARLSLRYRHPLLPGAANPCLPSGGLINESKDLIYRRLPRGPWTLRHALLPAGCTAARARATLKRLGLGYPVIAKPDQGQRGSGVRRLRDPADLAAYAAAAKRPWLLQEYCGLAHEAGVFYVRRPGAARGFLYSITDKRFPIVTGDGRRRLAELILDHPRYRLQADTFFARHRGGLDRVLGSGETLRLAEAGNHSQGALFLDGRALGGTGLLKTLDRIAAGTPGFHLGRFDLRYEDPKTFRQGRGFKLIELNLGGAEATHIYDPAVSLAEAYRVLFGQWDLLFELGDLQRKKGKPVPTPGAFLRDAWDYHRAAATHGVAD